MNNQSYWIFTVPKNNQYYNFFLDHVTKSKMLKELRMDLEMIKSDINALDTTTNNILNNFESKNNNIFKDLHTD